MSLATQILLGLLLGIGTGLFVGEPMGILSVVGDAYISLLQMTVLPYVVASLIASLGRLDYHTARTLAVRGGALLALLWLIALSVVIIMPLSFPELETASFFSTTLVERAPPIDYVGLYIPSNPFHSMANNVVPAVVLFSVAVGIALIGMPGKQYLIEPLETLNGALQRVASFIARLTPVGVFAIGASTAGTMTFVEFQRVQVYLVTYILFVLVMSFWILPGLVAALTTLRQRDIISYSRGALITAFATGSEFIVLPFLASIGKQLLKRDAQTVDDPVKVVDVIIPVAYTFPHIAKVLSLSFIPFAAWFSDLALSISEYTKLVMVGIVILFGSINVALPFLLDMMQIPEDLFQLFLATSVLNARFGTLLAAMHILTLTLLAASALTGGLGVHSWGLFRVVLGTLLLVISVVLGTRAFFGVFIDTTYRKDEILGDMQLIRDAVPVVVHRQQSPVPSLESDTTRLEAILERGSLRVCYQAEGKLPFAYFNARDELVGFDVEMAHSLARGMGVTLEFVPVESSFRGGRQAEALNSGYCDIAMARNVLSMTKSSSVDYSQPYLNLTLAFIVRDHRQREFSIRDQLERRDDLRIAIPNDRYYITRMERFVPRAELVPVQTVRQFLNAEPGEFDAMLYAAEIGSAWSLLRPEFDVVVPEPSLQKMPMAYPVPLGELDWLNTVDAWIELKKTDGTIQQLYDYWILGREAQQRQPRWSVIRDVLHWVD